MTYYGSIELAASFRTVRGNTLIIAEEIPEDKYGMSVAPGARTVAEMLVHIAVTPRVQTQVQFVERRDTLVGFDFFSFMGAIQAEEKQPRTKAEILELLRAEGEAFAQKLEGASEEFLGEKVGYPQTMTPPSKSRFEMLLGVKEHEMHHRAQLMVAERIIGITPHLTRQMEERIAAMRAAQPKA